MANTNILYMTNAGNFEYSDNSTIIKIEDMLQRLQTFVGEQSFNAKNGIDYISVFNNQAFLNPQIDAIINDYTQYFQQIVYTVTSTTRESITVDLKITLFNGDVALRSFVV